MQTQFKTLGKKPDYTGKLSPLLDERFDLMNEEEQRSLLYAFFNRSEDIRKAMALR